MTKGEFLTSLEERLSGLPEEDIRRSEEYYAELLADKIEEGMGEEEAVADLPPLDEIVSKIIAEVPITRLVGNRLKPKRRLETWEILLLALGFPVWFSLLIAVVAVVLSVFVALFAAIFAFYATAFATAAVGVVRFWGGISALLAGEVATAAVGVVRFWGGISALLAGEVATAATLVGIGLLCVGVAILLYLLTNKMEKPIWKTAKKLWIWIKRCFVKEAKV